MQPDFQSNLSEYTVGELARRLRGLVEQSFQHVRVRGEISNCKRAASGHCYFTLHDQDAVLQAICWRSKLGLLETLPQDGLEVVVAGRLTTYAQRSSYQIIVEVLKPAGIGALLKLLEERKRKLAQEGLFDVQRKKQLPFLARRIIVMTSPSGAVIRDLIHRLSERLPVELWVLPIPVQGSEASSKIVDAFCRLKKLAPADAPDLVIIARGGGSLEDLWAFNEEHTVRAAADCPWPLISAIGHETDHSLIDLVADHRAPTPSAAGEMAVPVLRELKAVLAGLSARLEQAPLRMIKSLHRLVEAQARGLPNPELLYSRTVQRLDEQTMRLARLIHHRL
ncbi:MAG: exodeoxyribonuclease VII large subunit, partial [Pseudomonadota bacterium]